MFYSSYVFARDGTLIFGMSQFFSIHINQAKMPIN